MQAVLRIEGEEAHIVDFRYGFSALQDYNTGRPVSRIRPENIYFTIESCNVDFKKLILRWVSNATKAKDGKVEIMDINGIVLSIIEFSHAFIMHFDEKIEYVNPNPVFYFSIASKRIIVDDVDIDNRWPDIE